MCLLQYEYSLFFRDLLCWRLFTNEVVCHLYGDVALLLAECLLWHVAGNTVSVRLFWADRDPCKFGWWSNAIGMALRADSTILFVVCTGVLMRIMAGDAGKTIVAILEALAFCDPMRLEPLGHILIGIGNVYGAAVAHPTEFVRLFTRKVCFAIYIVGWLVCLSHGIYVVASCSMTTLTAYSKKLFIGD